MIFTVKYFIEMNLQLASQLFTVYKQLLQRILIHFQIYPSKGFPIDSSICKPVLQSIISAING